MIEKLFICTDLDRTLLPNGNQPESDGAREMFHGIVSRPDVTLSFVTGRDKLLVLEAIKVFNLPMPDFVISDVGTNIYSVSDNDNKWQLCRNWHREVSRSWHERSHAEMISLLQPLSVLNLQESHKQSTYKLSYYVSPNHLDDELINTINKILKSENIEAAVVSSINEKTQTGLLDILPKNASKLHAIKYLMAENNYHIDNTIFAGDSGNDLDVFASDIKSVCVNNATAEVKKLVAIRLDKEGNNGSCYLAKGGLNNFNGNYSAGIIEGISHYFPEFLNASLDDFKFI